MTEGVFRSPAPRIYSIDAGRPFLSDLCRALRASVEAEGALLADALVYLPTRRAVRALGEAFVETAPGGRASLLPRLRAVGDIDEDEFAIFEGAVEDEIDLPPAISETERRFGLARLIAAADRAFDGHERWAGALAAADELARLIDSFHTEEIAPEALRGLVPDALAEHWKRSLDFLAIVTDAWPRHLNEIGRMDPAERRVKLIDRQSGAWEAAPPAHPVIVAGTTGSTPAVARLMKRVASLPLGCIVLPGLDRDGDARFWDAVDAPHPQSGLKHLLAELGVDRGAVRPWPAGAANPRGARRDLIAVALRPANASDSWRDWASAVARDRAALDAALEGLELIEAASEEREADAVAIRIRAALEAPEKKTFLVTPDRDLARRVAAKLRRWRIIIDDSAGLPFAHTPCGTFLRLVARSLADISDAVALMAMLRHPLFGAGLGAAPRRKAVNAMDRALRGLRPGPGAAGLRARIAARGRAEAAAPVMTAMDAVIARWPAPAAPFAERLAAHLQIAELLAAVDGETGAERLWSGEDGEAGAAGLAQTVAAAEAVANDSPADYPEIFDQMIASIVVRRRAPGHPRVFILGPLEARLQAADVVILGGLNEGVWPRDAAIDPFLSRPMREDVGLPSPEQRIGLAAHDFAQLAAAPEVVLTRSVMAGGKPAKPSRWIVRFKNILKGAGALGPVVRADYYEQLAQTLNAPEGPATPAAAPAPRPPLEARPAKLYVTRIERLMRDPYSVYARSVLRLKKLDALNEPLDGRHIGQLFHRVLFEFASGDPPQDETARIAQIEALFERLAPEFGLTDQHRPFWEPRVREAFAFFAESEDARRAVGAPAVLEGVGEWTFDIDGREFTLAARADRIDRLKDGSAFVVDYKSGNPPTLKQSARFSPQLPLTGLIVEEGGFSELGAVPAAGFEYVRILGRKGDGKDDVGAEAEDGAAMIAEAQAGLVALMRHFNNPQTPYLSQPRPQFMDEYGDYDHLARRRERLAQGSEE